MNCPACLGPNPDCDTCAGSGEVTQKIYDTFMTNMSNIKALNEYRQSVDDIIRSAQTVEDAKAEIAKI